MAQDYADNYETVESDTFDVNDLYDYQREYVSEEVGVCALGRTKSYMDYSTKIATS